MDLTLGVVYPWDSPFLFTEAVDRLVNLERPSETTVRFFRGRGWCPAARHIDGCSRALDWGADLIAIVGADQGHPEDLLVRLVARWREGYEVVAALVPTRGYLDFQPMRPFERLAWRFKPIQEVEPGRTFRGLRYDPDMVDVIRPGTGMQRVHFIGSGVLMFHRDHLLALAEPWFQETIVNRRYRRIANMDTTFVYRLQTEAHAQVWADTTIEETHLHVFPIDGTYPDRFPDWRPA